MENIKLSDLINISGLFLVCKSKFAMVSPDVCHYGDTIGVSVWLLCFLNYLGKIPSGGGVT